MPADQEMKESWTAKGDPDALRAEFAGWDPRIGVLLDKVNSTFKWALYDRDPLPTWTKGRLTLLGDAAHPMLPHLGQGANQSIEDGMALATILARTDRATAPAALVAYEDLRRERVASVQRGARENGLRYDTMLGDVTKRDAEITAHAVVPQAALRSRRGAGRAEGGDGTGLNSLAGRQLAERMNFSFGGLPALRHLLRSADQRIQACRALLRPSCPAPSRPGENRATSRRRRSEPDKSA